MESRFKKTSKNLFFQLLYQVSNLILGMILPALIIQAYGSEINGLTSTVKQIITLATLAKAGISTAATFSTYKFVHDENRIKIAEILNTIKRTFFKISIIVFFIGLIASILFCFAQAGSVPKIYIFTACFLFCMHTVIDLAFTMHYNVFFTATQDKYVISIGLFLYILVTYGIQLSAIFFKASFLWLYAASIFGCIIKILFLRVIYKKKYAPYKLLKNEQPNYGKTKLFGVGYATLNEISHCLITATQTIILSVVYGFKEASVYGVYLIVIDALLLIGQVVYTSFTPSYGSIIAEGDVNRVNRVFSIFQCAYYMLNTLLFMCATILFVPFIRIYTGNVLDMNYENYLLAYGLILYGLFSAYRIPYNITVSCIGAFKKSGIQACITSVVSLVFAIVFVQIDYALVILGPILFYIVNTFYQHFMLKKEYKGFDNSGFFPSLFITGICIITAMITGIYIDSIYTPQNYFQWFAMAVLVAFMALLILLSLELIFNKKRTVKTLVYFKGKIKLKKEKR